VDIKKTAFGESSFSLSIYEFLNINFHYIHFKLDIDFVVYVNQRYDKV